MGSNSHSGLMCPLTSPGPTLGVIGGGQLGRMLAEAASPLGVELVVLDPTPGCPASTASTDHIIGNFDDSQAVAELAARSDILTYEIELADPDLLSRASRDHGTPVYPSPDTLRMIQDKLVQKRALSAANIPVAPYRSVDDADGLRRTLSTLGYPAMLKARRGGYDGRGNVPIETESDIDDAIELIEGKTMVEAFVDFTRELSVIGVKGQNEIRTYVAGENVHEAEILRETIIPARAPDSTHDRAQTIARNVLEHVSGRGVYGIELFERTDGEILVNEIAPRPHNTGHWTIEGAMTSQFEQHIRAVFDLPLGSTTVRNPTVTTNILGDTTRAHPARLYGLSDVLSEPAVHFHWYGKREVRPLRKMGHLTVSGSDEATQNELLETARTYNGRLTFQP